MVVEHVQDVRLGAASARGPARGRDEDVGD